MKYFLEKNNEVLTQSYDAIYDTRKRHKLYFELFLWKKKLKLSVAQNLIFVVNLMMRMRMVFATNVLLQPHVRVGRVGETPGARLSCLFSKIDLEAALTRH